MRHPALGLLFGASLLTATGCGKSPQANVQANQRMAPLLYMVVPGPVTGNRTHGLNSWFKVVRAKPGDADAIESDRYGGECILFRASDLGYEVANKVCSSDEDCANGKGPGYCDAAAHQCWARPNVDDNAATDPLCRRSIDTATASKPDGTQWKEGELNWISAQPIPVPQGLRPNAQARTVAILKGRSGTTPPLIVRWGEPTAIP